MSSTLTTYALDGVGSPVSWDLEEVELTLPLQGFWIASLRTTSTIGRLGAPGANPTAGAPGQTPSTDPAAATTLDVSPNAAGLTYQASGPLYDPSGKQYTKLADAPPWVYAGLSAYQPVTITLNGVDFCGTIVRSGLWRGEVGLLIQAGKTQVGGYPGGGWNRVTPSTVYDLLQGVADAANVRLSSLIDTTAAKYSALLMQLDFQPSGTLGFADTLDQLVAALNAAAGPDWAETQRLIYANQDLWPPTVVPVPDLYHWRFLPDGTLWMGLDFYQTEADAGTAIQDSPVPELSSSDTSDQVTWLDNRAQQGLETFGLTRPILFPGDTYVSPQTKYGLPWPLTAQVSIACAVEYHWSGVRLLMKVLNGAANSPVTGVTSSQQGGQVAFRGW